MLLTHGSSAGLGRSGLVVHSRPTWALLSGVGMLVGAGFGLWLFPGAAAGQNPVGQYGYHLVGFAALIGAGFGVAQAAGLNIMLRVDQATRPGESTGSLSIGWVTVSVLGVSLMLLPLWSVHIMDILNMPLIAVALMLPGLIVLGLAQWSLIRRFRVVLSRWMTRTVLGGLLGVVIGIASFFATLLLGVAAPLDLMGAFFIGLGIGWLQAPCLETVISPPSNR